MEHTIASVKFDLNFDLNKNGIRITNELQLHDLLSTWLFKNGIESIFGHENGSNMPGEITDPDSAAYIDTFIKLGAQGIFNLILKGSNLKHWETDQMIDQFCEHLKEKNKLKYEEC